MVTECYLIVEHLPLTIIFAMLVPMAWSPDPDTKWSPHTLVPPHALAVPTLSLSVDPPPLIMAFSSTSPPPCCWFCGSKISTLDGCQVYPPPPARHFVGRLSWVTSPSDLMSSCWWWWGGAAETDIMQLLLMPPGLLWYVGDVPQNWFCCCWWTMLHFLMALVAVSVGYWLQMLVLVVLLFLYEKMLV